MQMFTIEQMSNRLAALAKGQNSLIVVTACIQVLHAVTKQVRLPQVVLSVAITLRNVADDLVAYAQKLSTSANSDTFEEKQP